MRRIVFPEWREVLTPGVFPRPLGLVWGEANQRAELILVLGFPPRAICAEIPKQLSRSDQLTNKVAARRGGPIANPVPVHLPIPAQSD